MSFANVPVDSNPVQFHAELPKTTRKSGPRAMKPELQHVLDECRLNPGQWAVFKRGCSKSYQAICRKNEKFVEFKFALRTGEDGVRTCWVMFPERVVEVQEG